MVFSALNLVFVACVAFSLNFWHFCSYLCNMSFPPFSDRFFMVCYSFSPCMRHVILVLYFTYSFQLYFMVCVFSVSIVFRISCSLSLCNPLLLLIIFSFPLLVTVKMIFVSISLFVRLYSRNRTC